jgi:hypothetical protein
MASSVPNNMFASTEKSKHRNSLGQFTDAASDSLDWVYADDIAFFKQWGISKIMATASPNTKPKRLRITQLKK